MTLKIEYVNKEDLKPYANNAKLHDAEQVEQIKKSIREFGFNDPVAVWHDNEIIEGHGRLLAVMEMDDINTVPVIRLDELSDEQRRAYMLVHNKLTMNTDFDIDLLNFELDDIVDIDMSGFGFDVLGSEPDDFSNVLEPRNRLTDKFIAPPFSIIDTRKSYWQNRKKAWKELGIKSEIGRDVDSLPSSFGEKYGRKAMPSVSIFDPVLCEIMYKWFCIDGGHIYDCFAGGSVRGIVAEKLGYKYTGIDIRQEQVDANYNNAAELDVAPVWYCDDSKNVDKYLSDGSQDLVFSCPPYGDLEVYSDTPGDISNMEYEEFCVAYREIINAACRKLKDNRFAVFVVSDIRDKVGAYRNFVDYTKKCFNENGLVTYNEFILVDMLGTAMLRANVFNKGRKAVKVHQNVLVFYKGEIKQIKSIFNEIESDDRWYTEYLETENDGE